ncbi:MAG: DUF1801 domain-containing protein [Saprospiraceae bacterium]|nr:DUF1801 domain-containing protein [Saprospiraceae bacterium]
MAKTKNKPYGSIKFQNIDQYHNAFSEPVKTRLNEIRDIIQQTAPQAEECISYNIPTYKLNGNLVHYAAFKSHLGFYPAPEAITLFKKELEPYKTSKGAIQFPFEQELPVGLIKRIVQHRVQVMQHKI